MTRISDVLSCDVVDADGRHVGRVSDVRFVMDGPVDGALARLRLDAIMVGGNALAALVHPLFVAGLICDIANGAELWRNGTAVVTLDSAIYGASAIIGYLSSAFLGWLGLMRRGLLTSAWVLILTPAHWLLLSLAAWRALYQLAVAPHTWEKTEHGLAKTSRRVMAAAGRRPYSAVVTPGGEALSRIRRKG
jgi:hypothetical protein